MKVQKAIKLSVKNLESFGRIYFTQKQLYYEICRVLAVNFRLGIFGNKTLKPPISLGEFEAELKIYLQNNELVGFLQIKPEIVFPQKFPPDLMLYGLPHVLVCESLEIAQMLRANQFHMQTPCGVLSLSEATPLSENFQKMLANAEKPRLFFLHNASLGAFTKIRNLRQTIELKEDIPFRPIGLRPVHAKRLQLFSTKSEPKDFDFSGVDYLSDDEKTWLLEGNSAEIEAVSPVRLLRALRRIILGLEIQQSDWRIKLPKKELGFM